MELRWPGLTTAAAPEGVVAGVPGTVGVGETVGVVVVAVGVADGAVCSSDQIGTATAAGSFAGTAS